MGQAWRLHVHPHDSSQAAYVNSSGDIKWSLSEIEVPMVEQCTREDAIEIQDIRELGLGWAWYVNDLRAFLPAWQDMELASPYPEQPLTQIDADVPVGPLSLQADKADLALDLHSYERPLAVSPFGTPEHVPDLCRINPLDTLHPYVPPGSPASLLPSGGGGPPSFSKFWDICSGFVQLR